MKLPLPKIVHFVACQHQEKILKRPIRILWGLLSEKRIQERESLFKATRKKERRYRLFFLNDWAVSDVVVLSRQCIECVCEGRKNKAWPAIDPFPLSQVSHKHEKRESQEKSLVVSRLKKDWLWRQSESGSPFFSPIPSFFFQNLGRGSFLGLAWGSSISGLLSHFSHL